MNKITLKQAIANMDFSKLDDEYGVEEFQRALGLEQTYTDSDKIASRLKSGYLRKWICTDTWVGLAVFFLDGRPVAITQQSARKSDIHVTFIDAAGVDAMRDFCISLLTESEHHDVPILADDIMIDEFYTVDYGSQLLTKFGFYNGEPVDVIRTWHSYGDIDKWHDVEVRLPDGTLKTINTKEFMIPVGT